MTTVASAKFSISGADAKTLWAEVQANRRRLEACALHQFSAVHVKLGDKQRCEACGGEMRLTDIGQYIAGYEAAGRSADDIWPGYRKSRSTPHYEHR